MRALLFRARSVAIVASLLALADCRPSSSIVPAPAPAAPRAETTPLPAPRVAALIPKAQVTLTSSDGKGLTLAKLSARAVLVGPLAFTELRFTFQNPEARTLEGTFAAALPPGASVSRFAMRIGDAWQEGEVVEKQRARAAFEEFLHRKRDPALLEQSAGNEFRARVFPIPAGGTKEILLSYAQQVRGAEPYVLPLHGLPEIGEVDLAATAEGSNVALAARRQARWTPDADFVVDRTAFAGTEGLRSGGLALVRARPVVELRPDPVTSAVVLVDTSASRALDLDGQVTALAALVSRLAEASPDASLTVACFDQAVEPVYQGPASGFGAAQTDRIRARGALGASDVVQALAWAGEQAGKTKARRVILMSDGVATAGQVERSALVAAGRALGQAGVERLDAVASGGVRDDAALASLVHAGLARDGIVADGAAAPEETARRLGAATASDIAVDVPGASWWSPRTIAGAQPGDEVLVYAELPAGAPVAVSLGGLPPVRPALRPVEGPLLERAWAQARIEGLLADAAAGEGEESVRSEVIALSTAHRVLSPYTALLVLETEQDYQRFHLDRTALVDLLEISGSRVVRTHRAGGAIPPAPSAAPLPAKQLQAEGDAVQFGMIGLLSASGDPNAPAAPWGREDSRGSGASGNLFGEGVGDAFGAGGLGLSGVGAGGGGARGEGVRARGEGGEQGSMGGIGQGNMGTLGHGSGSGRLGASTAAPQPPALRMGATTVSGRLPPEVIQRIVRQNAGRFRLCYERELGAHPGLQGRVAIRFLIDRTGAVTSVADGGSDIGDAALVACVARSFQLLSFPQPEGGTSVTVVYPMTFSPGQGWVPASRGAAVAGAGRPSPEPAADPYTGRFAEVMRLLATGDRARARETAWGWRREEPGDVLALVALGEALEASGDLPTASRAYGSIVDLYPTSVDMRRMAGERLERLRQDGGALRLAADTFGKAVADRPDHPSSHRMLTYARLRLGDFAGAFDAAVAGLAAHYPEGRYRGVDQILREDLGLVGAAWAAAEPARRAEIAARVRASGGVVQEGPSLRFVLSWESDANDVDLHVRDAGGDHAFYGQPTLASGGHLFADVTTGYGPECFAVDAAPGRRSPRYALQVHYYSRGPMGYGMGKVEIVEHDGRGGLTFDERPFVVMSDGAFVDLGEYPRAKKPG